MSYRVELPVYSGPMDLLLHLVKQQEVDVHEVSVSRILDDYLRHLEVLEALDLADIGDFAVMASTLMEIKSRELLPREDVADEEQFDPRDDLIRRLLEYKRYRDLSRRLDRMAKRRARMFEAGVPVPKEVLQPEPAEDVLDLGDVDVFTLTAAFSKLLRETGQQQTGPLLVGIERRSIRFYTEQILDRVRARDEVPFMALFEPAEGRYALIGVFTAMLEMVKQGYLRAHQDGLFGPIVVVYRGPEDLTADAIAAGEVAAATDAADSGDVEDPEDPEDPAGPPEPGAPAT